VRQDWLDLLLAFHVLTPVELELFRIREEIAAPLKAPRSFAELMRSGDTASSIRTATGLFNTLRQIAGAMQNNPEGAQHNEAMNETTVKILDDEGSRVITERFSEYAKIHASDRPQLVVCVNGESTTKEWVWHYMNALANAWQKHCMILPAQTPTRPLMDILVTPVTWPSDPTIMVDLQALRVQAGLLSIAANVTRERTVLHQAEFWSGNLQRIREIYYVKVVLGKANLAEWAALSASARGGTAKRPRPDTDQVTDPEPSAWKKKRADLAAEKKKKSQFSRDKSARDGKAKTAAPADAPTAAADKPEKKYSKCDKCGKSAPDGRLSAFPSCYPCRKKS
jgi:hypothetical protein